MAIVTGDRYLESLVKFVEKQAGPLIEGALVLKLNPVGLHYVESRLESLAELERLLAGAPVDYLRAYVSDLGDHRALEQLRRILRLLTSLKVISVLPPPCRDPTPLCLLPFSRLKVLELRGCDLSTSASRGLLELRHTLEKIICHNSTDALRHVFASRIAEIEDSPQWKRLSFVSCAYNGLVLMDESLRLLPVVETLDLSRNKFPKVDNLWKCGKLKHLDLGFNQLRTIASFSKVSCQIVKLVLRNNALTTLRGLENLKSLEGLDLSYNIISNFSELELVAGLTSLKSLWLEGNPLCHAIWYRAQVFSFFAEPDKLILDDKKISTKEVWKRQIIIARKHKQPASFGFYSPAKDDAELDGSINARKRKKLSRVASIESETMSTIVHSDNESMTCKDDTRSEQENAESNEVTEIDDFIDKIEFMKRERSVLWLEEFKQWLNHVSDDHMEGGMHSELASIPVKESDPKKKRREKHFGETSRYASDPVEASGDENRGKFSVSYNSFHDLSLSTGSQQYSYQVSEAASQHVPGDANKDVSVADHMKLKSFYDEASNTIRDTTSHIDFQVPRDEVIRSDIYKKVEAVKATSSSHSFMSLNAIDDIIEAHSPTASAASPPHYKEDILHRRQNLEEEFLQLSAESYSVVSSDSYTSDSGDDSVEVGSHMRTHSTVDELERSVDSQSVVLSSEDSYCDRRQDISHVTANGTSSFSSFADYPISLEPKDSDSFQQSCNSYQGSLPDGEIVRLFKQEANWLEKKMYKRKPKTRVVSLTEETNSDPATKSLDKLNCSYASGGDVRDVLKGEADMSNGSQMPADETHPITNEGWEVLHGAESSASRAEELISNYFNENLADYGVEETCRQYLCCSCMLEEPSGCKESEVVVLLSSEIKLYILIVNSKHDGSGFKPSILGSYRSQDVKEVLLGLGLQVMRVHLERGARYMFITRSIEKSRQLLSILEIFQSHAKKSIFPLRSLEQIQVALFDRYVCGGSKTSILQYSMVQFWNNNLEEEVWLSRSLFVLGGHMLLCIENISQFGFDSEDACTPYFSLDSCCSIVNALEMVQDAGKSCTVTLALECVASEFPPSDLNKNLENPLVRKETPVSPPVTWKLKWSSEDSLFKFVTLVKALHDRAAKFPLVVR